MPAKNEEEYICDCLLALLSQEYPSDRHEVIVVDNASTDKTPIIVQNFNPKKNIKLVHKEGGTISSVRNFGVQFAKGEILAFLDGDCVPGPRWIREGVRCLAENKNLGCVGFSAAKPGPEATWVELAWQHISSTGKHKDGTFVPWLSSFNLVLWRKVFEEFKGFNEALITCEDADFGYRVGSKYRLLLSNMLTVRHLGSVKTLREFYIKEKWRGQSNLKNFFYSVNKRHDFASVFVPIFYFLLVMAFGATIVCLALGFAWPDDLVAYFMGVLIVGVPIVLTLIKSKNVKGFVRFCQVSLLFSVYLFARGQIVLRSFVVYGKS